MRRLLISIFIFSSFWASPASAEWWEAETAHFVVKSRANQEDAREYALEMEKFDASLRIMFGLPLDHVEASRANKPTVYRFGRPRDMARLINASGSGVAGFFISRAGNSVAFAPTRKGRDTSSKTSWQIRDDPRADLDPRSILLHEYTHYFMMQHFPAAYPRWYIEGFAEMMGTARFNEDGSVHIGDPPQYRATQIFKLRPFPMDEMLDPGHKLSGLDALQHYATGWLLAHYLSFDSDRQLKLRRYLYAISEGENGLEAAKREFGDLSALDRELSDYKRGPFPGREISSVSFNTDVVMRQLSAAEEDSINIEMRIARGLEDEDEARDFASDLENILQRHPGDQHLLSLLAWSRLGAKDLDGAEQAAAQLDKASIDFWLAKTGIAIERIKDDPANAELARDFATEASLLDRNDPRPLMAYYYSYVESKEDVPESAAIALEQAFKSAGSDPAYRLLLSRQLLLEDRLQSARIVLMPIAFRGHKTEEPKNEEDPTLTRVLALIDEQDREGALAMIEKMMEDEEDEDDKGNGSDA